jgi:hypothetical protein
MVALYLIDSAICGQAASPESLSTIIRTVHKFGIRQ